MSSSTAIGQVSESLHKLLTEEMTLDPSVPVTVLAPDESGGGNRRINLFLYKVRENPHLNQGNWQVRPGNPDRLVPPPLSLNLYYLITPYAANDANLGNANAHEILGEAMRVFAKFPVVPELYLADGLETSREEIRIMQSGLDIEELSQVWSTFSQPFRLSVLYEVSAVQLDLGVPGKPLPKRVSRIATPDIGTIPPRRRDSA